MTQNNSSINSSDGFHNGSWYLDEDYKKKQDLFIKHKHAEFIFVCIISVVEIPIMFLTLFALCFLIKSHRGASVFIINLILSDLIQLICILISVFTWSRQLVGAHYYSLIVGLYFMVCVAIERYLLVCHPHCYKSRHSLKLSCFISLIVWFVPLIYAEIKPPYLFITILPRSVACFIPYPIIILCFVGTCRGLSRAISLTPVKRQLILGSLFLVLLTYTFLILPFIILNFVIYFFENTDDFLTFKIYCFLKYLLYLNLLADCLLYLFMRADVGDIMTSFDCCGRSSDRQQTQSTTRMSTL